MLLSAPTPTLDLETETPKPGPVMKEYTINLVRVSYDDLRYTPLLKGVLKSPGTLNAKP